MERDDETGLHYHHHRYYAPWLGRWTRPDPAGLVDGPGRFSYVGGNPVGGRDASGLQEDSILRTSREAQSVLPESLANRYSRGDLGPGVYRGEDDSGRGYLARVADLGSGLTRLEVYYFGVESESFYEARGATKPQAEQLAASAASKNAFIGRQVEGEGTSIADALDRYEQLTGSLVPMMIAGLAGAMAELATAGSMAYSYVDDLANQTLKSAGRAKASRVRRRPKPPPQLAGSAKWLDGVNLPDGDLALGLFGKTDSSGAEIPLLSNFAEESGSFTFMSVAARASSTPSRDVFEWAEFSLEMIRKQLARGGEIRFNLEGMDDVADVLTESGPNAWSITAMELRYLRAHWGEVKEYVSFWRGTEKAAVPWN